MEGLNRPCHKCILTEPTSFCVESGFSSPLRLFAW